MPCTVTIQVNTVCCSYTSQVVSCFMRWCEQGQSHIDYLQVPFTYYLLFFYNYTVAARIFTVLLQLACGQTLIL